MAIHFRDATLAPLHQLTVSAPDAAVIGILGEDASGQRQLLQLAAGVERASSGEVEGGAPSRYLGPLDGLNLAPCSLLAIDHTLSCVDALVRARALMGLERLRRSGATILIASHDLELLSSFADEIWWLHEGRLTAKGDPREVIPQYLHYIAGRQRAWGESIHAPLLPSLRRGDGRAEILGIETLGASGQPTGVLQSGEPMTIRVTIRFQAAVSNPVVGIMIRTRIGSEVYGTNTELERYNLHPVEPGTTLRISFSMECRLCPQEYAITAASHDPDGVWHDWMEDALAFSVADTRYTAGVANLRASIAAEQL